MSVLIDGVDTDTFWYEYLDETVLQLSVGLDLYFSRPMDDHRREVLEVWTGFLRGLDEPVSPTWARLGGGNTSRAFGPGSLATVSGWMNGRRSYGLTCFMGVHDGPWEEIGGHAFLLYGNNRSAASDSGRTWFHSQRVTPAWNRTTPKTGSTRPPAVFPA